MPKLIRVTLCIMIQCVECAGLIAQDKKDIFIRALVFPRGAEGITGYVIDVDDDSTIVLVTTAGEKRVPLREVKRLVLRSEPKGGNGFLYGALLGFYGGIYVFGRKEGEPAAYLKDKFFSEPGAIIFWGSLSISAGGGIGYVIDPNSGVSDEVFAFADNPNEFEQEHDRLIQYLRKKPFKHSIHVSFQGGHVFVQASNRMDELLREAGYSIESHEGGFLSANRFNWLRKLQLTYSVLPELDAGVGILLFGEPSTTGSKYIYDQSTRTNQSWSVGQSLRCTGYYAIGMYKPPFVEHAKRLDANAGIGLGVANIDYTLKTSSTTSITAPPYTSSTTAQHYAISGLAFSGMIFGSFSYYLADGLSLGITADYVVALKGGNNVPAIPEASLPAQTVRFQNSSIGFIIGLHF